VAVAVAADPRRYRGVGIDVEPRGTLDASLVDDSFGEAERCVLQAAARDAGEELDDWHTAAWCAKEAAGKAVGRGVVGGPRSLEIVAVEARSGRFWIELRGGLAQAVPGVGGVAVERRIHGELVLALCLIDADAAVSGAVS
jgi:4'-phosphopantetheinyl transferase EntD